jgi:hypothetical protein
MPFILRNPAGKIVRASVRPLVGGEALPHHNPEVLQFLLDHQQDPQQVVDALAELQITDGEMARAIEDIVIILLKKNIFKMSELPRPVQDRMALRTKLRTKIEETYDKASRAAEKEHPRQQDKPADGSATVTPGDNVTHAVA